MNNGQDKIADSQLVYPAGAVEAIHRDESDIPFAAVGDGSFMQLLQVDLSQGLWILRMRFPVGGVSVEKHYHTGQVFAVTLKGSWYYKEYPETINRPGSYLYEPAGSVHTLVIDPACEEETEIWFCVHGSNLDLNSKGEVVRVSSARDMLSSYRALCESQGLSHDRVNIVGEAC